MSFLVTGAVTELPRFVGDFVGKLALCQICGNVRNRVLKFLKVVFFLNDKFIVSF